MDFGSLPQGLYLYRLFGIHRDLYFLYLSNRQFTYVDKTLSWSYSRSELLIFVLLRHPVRSRAGHFATGQVVFYCQCIIEKSRVHYRHHFTNFSFPRAVRVTVLPLLKLKMCYPNLLMRNPQNKIKKFKKYNNKTILFDSRQAENHKS